ncbi:hypothetical protein BJF84_17170 [Rhodococcus sp. CUA-806]|nr:hypothetical protein BJF84_17170 [Rhodococcus sp. CUA-806]
MTEKDEWGRVPLHYAAMERPIEEVRQLLSQAVDPDPRDIGGWTPLLYAARSARPEVVSLLLDAGAQVDALAEKGLPAIYWAIVGRGEDPVGTIRVLRARGADPEAKTMEGYFGLTSPLDYIRDVTSTPEIRAEFADLL